MNIITVNREFGSGGRAKNREIVSAGKWGDQRAYHLTINITGQSVKEISASIAAFADCWFNRKSKEKKNNL